MSTLLFQAAWAVLLSCTLPWGPHVALLHGVLFVVDLLLWLDAVKLCSVSVDCLNGVKHGDDTVY